MDPADVDADGTRDRPAAQHDVEQAVEPESVTERVQHVGVGTEVDDVVEPVLPQRVERVRRDDRHLRAGRRREGGAR